MRYDLRGWALALLFALLVGGILLCLPGCAWTGTSAPAARWSRTRTETFPDGRTVTEKVEAASWGAGYRGDPPKDFANQPVTAGPGAAESGGMSFQGFKVLTSMQPMYVVAGLAIVAGAVLWWLVNWKLGAMVAGAGASVLFVVRLIESQPWVLFFPLALVLAAVGYGLWVLWRGERSRRALGLVAKEVERLPKASAEELKEAIGEAAGPVGSGPRRRVKDTITRAKKDVGLA